VTVCLDPKCDITCLGEELWCPAHRLRKDALIDELLKEINESDTDKSFDEFVAQIRKNRNSRKYHEDDHEGRDK
jgi:hypothetical protein